MSDFQKVESILIVGGGSAGWITANLLNARLNDGSGPPVKITLVEAPDIPVIGVGEATVPSIRRTMNIMGVSEKDLMRATDATFKSLIRFKDWNLGEEFDHPFDRRERPDTDAAILSWLQNQQAGNAFAQDFSILSNTAERMLAPKAVEWADYQSPFPYAYHLDAVKLAAMLTEFGAARGIQHRLAKIVEVKENERGDIATLTDEEGREYAADLYIDCTGFAARLASKTSPDEIDYSNNLLCDSAVTMNVSYEAWRPDHILPYTTAHALGHGWVWDINLQGRRGMGYVYSSSHIDRKDAEVEFRKFEGPHTEGIEAGHIRFKTYKRVNAWTGNCISIGLSDGFVEPLESTGLYMMQFAAQRLAEDLRPNRRFSNAMSAHFNQLMRTLYEEIIGYVTLHYVTSNRRDTGFWRDATDFDRVPRHLENLMEIWKTRPVTDTDLLIHHRLFSLESYEYLLFGMSYFQGEVPKGPASNFSLKPALEKCYARLPKHENWLAQSLR